MKQYAGLDVSLETTAICIVDETGRILAERKVATCPDAIARELRAEASGLVRAGMETGPLAVWLCGELKRRELPILCLDARHANAALKMMPNKTDRADARGLAQIVRTGWYREVVKLPCFGGRFRAWRRAGLFASPLRSGGASDTPGLSAAGWDYRSLQ
jgi:transposase